MWSGVETHTHREREKGGRVEHRLKATEMPSQPKAISCEKGVGTVIGWYWGCVDVLHWKSKTLLSTLL